MCNDWTHIESLIQNNREWSEHWKIIVNLPNRKYDLPKNSAGKKVLDILATKIKKVVNRKSKFKKVVVYMSTILQKSKDIKKASTTIYGSNIILRF